VRSAPSLNDSLQPRVGANGTGSGAGRAGITRTQKKRQAGKKALAIPPDMSYIYDISRGIGPGKIGKEAEKMQTSRIAERNSKIKKTLEQAFGRGKVRVSGLRGTGYGYVNVIIRYTPRDWQQRAELIKLCGSLLKAAGIDTYDDTGMHKTDMCHITFERTSN